MNGHVTPRHRAAVRTSAARTLGWLAAASLVVAALGPWASPSFAASVFVGTVVMCLGAAMLSFRRVASIDPALVFRT